MGFVKNILIIGVAKRINRVQHLCLTVFWYSVLVLGFACQFKAPGYDGGKVLVLGLLSTLLIIVSLISIWRSHVRRLHDLGLPTGYILLAFLPYVGFFLVNGYLNMSSGNPGINKYGLPTGSAGKYYYLMLLAPIIVMAIIMFFLNKNGWFDSTV